MKMIRDTLETIRSIRGCLEYLLEDAKDADLTHTSLLIQLAIADLRELSEFDEEMVRMPPGLSVH